MKMSLVLFTTAAVYFLTACNSGSENTTANTDTSTSTTTAAIEQPSTAQDTTKSDGLMKAMNDMMDKMNSMQMAGDFDVDFANMMVEHHQGALDMAQVELSQGNNETMEAKAQEIITMQKQEQQQLKDLYRITSHQA